MHTGNHGDNWIYKDDHGTLSVFMGPFLDETHTAIAVEQLNVRAKNGIRYKHVKGSPKGVPLSTDFPPSQWGRAGGR